MCKTCNVYADFNDNCIEHDNGYSRGVYLGIKFDCEECQGQWGYDDLNKFKADIDSGECEDEGSFSMHSCERCGNEFDGDRFVAHGYDDQWNPTHFEVCADCKFELGCGHMPHWTCSDDRIEYALDNNGLRVKAYG